MKIILTLFLVSCVVNSSFSMNDFSFKHLWEKFKKNHGKTYCMAKDEEYRMGIFKQNVDLIEKHNSEYSMGMHTYILGINYFADWTDEEFEQKMLGVKANLTEIKDRSTATFLKLPSEVKIADSFDWRDENIVTDVKDQGQCGSCWAFSSTGSLESAYARLTNELIPLSEQQLVDCSTSYEPNHGCHGGWMPSAFNYIKDVGGIESEEDYPYRANEGECTFDSSRAVVGCTGYVSVPSDDEEALKEAVATIGPIAVTIKVSQKFTLYKEGVFYDDTCYNLEFNHAVLLVGYGTDGTDDYWIVKNSWGTWWGDNGYIKMARNRENNCGIASYAFYPLVK